MKGSLTKRAAVWAAVIGFTATSAWAGVTWQVLENCHLIDNPLNAGDTIRVKQGSQEYTFRLYFVDAPEIRDTINSRVNDQAEYFGVSRDRAMEIGQSAAQFTASHLSDKFTVITRWENAHGRGKTPRFLAFVVAKGQDLGESLVQNGLARLVGERTVSPSGRTARSVGQSLQELEDQAKLNHIGGWSNGNFKINAHAALGTDQTHRLSINNGYRHNSHCSQFEAKDTRGCSPDEGRACPICGG